MDKVKNRQMSSAHKISLIEESSPSSLEETHFNPEDHLLLGSMDLFEQHIKNTLTRYVKSSLPQNGVLLFLSWRRCALL